MEAMNPFATTLSLAVVTACGAVLDVVKMVYSRPGTASAGTDEGRANTMKGDRGFGRD